ncbi:MAG: hypothetical protein IJY96_00975 [Oscillospiraceae bacterium]|nr:hypothetical protein [Oscillospiraceae bacterium]
MKKLLCLALALLLLLSACSDGGDGPDIGKEITSEVNTLEGVCMEVTGDFTTRAATVRVVNDTENDFVSDSLFSVQTEVDGKWYGLVNEYRGDSTSEMNLYARNKSGEYFCSWDHMYGPLPEGHYRIVFYVWDAQYRYSDADERHYVAAEFYVE